jgi:hypothetical protein
VATAPPTHSQSDHTSRASFSCSVPDVRTGKHLPVSISLLHYITQHYHVRLQAFNRRSHWLVQGVDAKWHAQHRRRPPPGQRRTRPTRKSPRRRDHRDPPRARASKAVIGPSLAFMSCRSSLDVICVSIAFCVLMELGPTVQCGCVSSIPYSAGCSGSSLLLRCETQVNGNITTGSQSQVPLILVPPTQPLTAAPRVMISSRWAIRSPKLTTRTCTAHGVLLSSSTPPIAQAPIPPASTPWQSDHPPSLQNSYPDT